MLNDEWVWAIGLCAMPFLIFAGIEFVAARRRRRSEAIARRAKGRGESRRPS